MRKLLFTAVCALAVLPMLEVSRAEAASAGFCRSWNAVCVSTSPKAECAQRHRDCLAGAWGKSANAYAASMAALLVVWAGAELLGGAGPLAVLVFGAWVGRAARAVTEEARHHARVSCPGKIVSFRPMA